MSSQPSTMAEAEMRLLAVVETIALEQEYQNPEIELKPVSSGGANYTSQLFAITLSSPGKDDLKMFAKVATLGEKIRSMSSLQVFDTEIAFYTRILPKYRALEELYKIPEEDKLVVAKYYGGTLEYAKEVLVLEDLTAKGYQPFDRFKCVDWEYASKCVNALARLHAVSVAFERNHPEEYTEIVEKLKYVLEADKLKDILIKSIETAVKSTDEKYKARVDNFLRDSLNKPVFTKFFYPERRILLTHGDFRPSNIVHKVEKDGKVKPVLLDYQIVQRGNPVTDLLYFLINSSDDKFRADHLYQFFEHYYEEFSKALARFGIDVTEVYSKQDFDKEVKEFLPFGLTVGALTLPIVTVDEAKAPKPEDGIDVDNLDMEVSSLFLIRFNGLVRDYVKMGFV